MSFWIEPLRIFCLVALVTLAPCAAQAEPRIPANDDEVLEHLPLRPGDRNAQALTQLRMAAKKGADATPPDPQPALNLAERYFDLAIARSDPRYIGYADATLQPYANIPSAAVLVLRGQLLQYRHQFDGALQAFATALQIDPSYAAAHAWRGAIFLVQADYPRAAIECKALQSLERFSLYGGCEGLRIAYQGQLTEADATLARALQVTRDSGNRLWLLTRLGEVAAWRGLPALAEQRFRDALALGLDDGYLLAAWSDFLLDQQRPSDVVRWLAPWEASDTLLLRLALAETQLQRPTAAAHVQALEDRFAAARLRGDTTHRAEEARFQLQLRGNARQALELAAANYQVQREPRDARILLEAAIAAHNPAPAQAARDWLRTSGFEGHAMRQLGVASSGIQTPAKTAQEPAR